MDNKEIIVVEDRLYKDSSIIVEFITPADNMGWSHEIVEASAKKFVDVLNDHLSSGFCTALSKRLREEGY